MGKQEMAQAWKNSTYRENLSREQQVQLPENPIGEELNEEELANIVGGGSSKRLPIPTPLSANPTCHKDHIYWQGTVE